MLHSLLTLTTPYFMLHSLLTLTTPYFMLHSLLSLSPQECDGQGDCVCGKCQCKKEEGSSGNDYTGKEKLQKKYKTVKVKTEPDRGSTEMVLSGTVSRFF